MSLCLVTPFGRVESRDPIGRPPWRWTSTLSATPVATSSCPVPRWRSWRCCAAKVASPPTVRWPSRPVPAPDDRRTTASSSAMPAPSRSSTGAPSTCRWRRGCSTPFGAVCRSTCRIGRRSARCCTSVPTRPTTCRSTSQPNTPGTRSSPDLCSSCRRSSTPPTSRSGKWSTLRNSSATRRATARPPMPR